MQQRIQVLQTLDKPAFVGESGICAGVGANGVCTGVVSPESLARRASFFEMKLSAGFRANICGYIIWNKGPRSAEDDIGRGDPTESVLAKHALGTSGKP
jgi:hypothetical protein